MKNEFFCAVYVEPKNHLVQTTTPTRRLATAVTIGRKAKRNLINLTIRGFDGKEHIISSARINNETAKVIIDFLQNAIQFEG